jgi:hypothetical protein
VNVCVRERERESERESEGAGDNSESWCVNMLGVVCVPVTGLRI